MADSKKNVSNTVAKNLQLRRRRRVRQLLGVAVLFFVVVGIVSFVSGAAILVRSSFDISDEIPVFEERVKYLVALDTLPFDSLINAPTDTLLYAAMIQAIDLNEDGDYERDENGQMYLPVEDISAAAQQLYGPDEKFNYITFTSDQTLFTYVPEKEAYLMPLTSPPTNYAPIAEALIRQGNKRRLTVGYDSPYDNVIQPAKYLDYIFERHDDGNYYLIAVVASEMTDALPQEEETAESTPQILPADNEALLDNAGDGILTDTVNSTQDESAQGTETAEAQSGEEATAEGAENAEATGDEQASDENADDGEQQDTDE